MPTGRQATLNEIRRYIENHTSGFNTRLEIDLTLLQKGYNPADIDKIWLEIQNRPAPKFNLWRWLVKKSQLLKIRWVPFAVGAIGLILAGLVFFLINAPSEHRTLVFGSVVSGYTEASFSPNGEVVVGFGDSIVFWDLPKQYAAIMYSTEKDTASLKKIAWSGDSKILAGQTATQINLWEAEISPEWAKIKLAVSAQPTTFGINYDGSELAISTDNEIRFWQVADRRYSGTRAIRISAVNEIRYSRDKRYLIVLSNRARILVYKADSLELLSEIICDEGISSFDFSPDETKLAVALANGKLRYYFKNSKETFKLAKELDFEFPNYPRLVAFSPSENKIAVASTADFYFSKEKSYPTIDIYSVDVLNNLQITQKIKGLERGVQSLQFSPTGDSLLTVDAGIIKLWKL